MYGYGGDYSGGNIGLVDRGVNDEGYKKRRSKRLLENPDAELDESQETKEYLEKLPDSYRKELEIYNENLPEMKGNCKLVVTVPAYGEGGNIFKTLNHFLAQKDQNGNPLDPSTYEFIIVDNYPENVAKDSTEAEVQRFKNLHPELNVQYVDKTWKEGDVAGVGNARKYANDLALLRNSKRTRRNGDLILVSFDADLDGINDKYISDLVTEFDNKPKLDAVAGKWTLPPEALAKPNLRAGQRLWYLLDRMIQKDAEGTPSERNPRSPSLVGRNAAFRSSIYAAIGGYNPNAKIAEDLEVGWMIDSARGYDAAKKGRMGFINRAEVTSNPRRFLASMVQGVPFIQMYGGFHENTSIRQLNNQDLLNQIPNTFDIKRFEKEADALWQAAKGPNGQYKWLGDRFDPIFSRIMGLMGVEYEIKNGHVTITSAQKLNDALSKPIAPHNPPQVTTAPRTNPFRPHTLAPPTTNPGTPPATPTT